jgi:hypothetical protein
MIIDEEWLSLIVDALMYQKMIWLITSYGDKKIGVEIHYKCYQDIIIPQKNFTERIVMICMRCYTKYELIGLT